MKRMKMIVVAAVITFAALIVSSSQTPRRVTRTTPNAQLARPQQFTLERMMTSQQRINRYFHSAVIPKLRNCWSRVQGKGTIAMKYSYANSGNGTWRFAKLETDSSTLPSAQQAVALACMQDAIRGTTFPIEGTERSQRSFVLNWNWPVPFPANATKLTSAMFAARVNNNPGGGGCDGQGTLAKCFNCDKDSLTCVKVCVGYQSCTVYNDPTAPCGAAEACASGGPFGVTGGEIIY